MRRQIGKFKKTFQDLFSCIVASKFNVFSVIMNNQSSWRNLPTHTTLDGTLYIALYLASPLDLEIVFCFFDFQLINELPRKKIYLDIDLLVSEQAAQS